MRFSHKTTRTVTRRLVFLLKRSSGLALMGMLFALTCWEVNPGQMPMPERDSAPPAASVFVVAPQTGQRLTSTHWIAAGDERIGTAPED